MFTRIAQLLKENKWKKVFILTICFGLLSAYPIYRNFYYGLAILQYERHIQFMKVQSRFHNPWQYRILTPLTVEVLKVTYDKTIDKIFPISEALSVKLPEGADPKESTKELLAMVSNPDFIKYTLIYSGVRFFQNIAIYFLCYILLAYFIRSNLLILFGLVLISLILGNSVNDSDLTLHTYLDDILYLITGILILYKLNPWYIVPLTIVGALNRETSLLIPFLYIISVMDWKKWINNKFSLKKLPWPTIQQTSIVVLSLLFFALIFVAIRWYYGYQPQTLWKAHAGLPMLKLNLASLLAIKSYFEMLGVFSILPLICLYKFKSTSPILQVWFIGIVPIWFLIHFATAVAYEGRLFLVPILLTFIPMFLEQVEQEYNELNLIKND